MLLMGAGFQEGSDVSKRLTTMLGYLLLVSTAALAQAAPTTTADVPWALIITGIIVVGGIVWWLYRSRGSRV
jgi:hypothetical protein